MYKDHYWYVMFGGKSKTDIDVSYVLLLGWVLGRSLVLLYMWE